MAGRKPIEPYQETGTKNQNIIRQTDRPTNTAAHESRRVVIDGSHAAARTYPDDETKGEKGKVQQLKPDIMGFVDKIQHCKRKNQHSGQILTANKTHIIKRVFCSCINV